MKYRKIDRKRVAYGFNGKLQDDLEAYRGFLEIAEPEGWEVIPLYEQFEHRVRQLAEAKTLDGVVGNFISKAWLDDLPLSLHTVHLADSALPGVPSVYPDTIELGRKAATHLLNMNYETLCWFSPVTLPGVVTGMEEVQEDVHSLRTLQALGEAVATSPRPGIFCASDFHARQAIHFVKKLGVSIPSDCGFLGTGDRFWDGVAVGMDISSIPIPHREMGKAAGNVLWRQFKGEAVSPVRITPGEVVIRSSSENPLASVSLETRVSQLFRASLTLAPDLNEIARQCGMSRRSFEKAFTQDAGCTPYEYFLKLRTDRARDLLRNQDEPVGRIGAEIGIDEPARFSAFFKKRTGLSPSAYRESLRPRNG